MKDTEKVAVSVVTFQGSGGMAHYAEMLSKAMEEVVHTCLVMIAMPDELLAHRDIQNVLPIRKSKRQFVRRFCQSYNVFFYRRAARTICQRTAPQLVHITSGVTGLLGFCRELHRHHVSIVYTVHDPLPHEERRTVWGKLYSAYQRRIQTPAVLRLCAAVHVHSNEHRRQLIGLYGAGIADKVYVVPHGAGLPGAVVSGCRKPPELRDVVSDSTLTLLFFGRIEPYKGLDILIAALKILEQRGCNVRLIVAGSGDLGLGDDATVPQSITLIHRFVPDDEVRHIFESADVVVLPYISATQSGVIPMAYAFGKPVISTDVGALRDVVDPGCTGLLVRPSDPVGLANAIEGLAMDRSRLAQMSSGARRFMNEQLAWRKVVAAHVDCYRKVVRGMPYLRNGTARISGKP